MYDFLLVVCSTVTVSQSCTVSEIFVFRDLAHSFGYDSSMDSQHTISYFLFVNKRILANIY